VQQMLKLLLGFVERLFIFLREVGDLISQACCFAQREKLGEEGSYQLIPSGNVSRW